MPKARPTLAVWKFASCDGCQLTLLDCEEELLAIAGAIDIAWFPEAGPERLERAYDVSLVEGSITTPGDAERIQQVRAMSRTLIAIGACATSGGVQALRNFVDVGQLARAVYAHPHYIATLEASTPIVHHVRVDFELRGCPIDKGQLIEVVSAYLHGRVPNVPTSSVCLECKLRGTVCLPVAKGVACLGPVTQAGCGALCPTYGRGCFGCFGPSEEPNVAGLVARLRKLGLDDDEIVRVLRTFNAGAEAFRSGSEAVEKGVEATPVTVGATR